MFTNYNIIKRIFTNYLLGERLTLTKKPKNKFLYQLILTLNKEIITKSILTGHEQSVRCIIALPNGEIASGSNDKTIRIWNNKSKCIKSTTETSEITCLLSLPNGEIAAGCENGNITIWNYIYNCGRTTTSGHTNQVSQMILLEDNGIASASWDNTIRIWDSEGKCIKVLKDHSGYVLSIVLLPSGYLVSGSKDKTLRIWDPGFECLEAIEGYELSFVLLILNDCIAVGSFRFIYILDNQGLEFIQKLEGHSSCITGMVLMSGSYLISASTDCIVRIWDIGLDYKCIITMGFEDSIRSIILLPNNNIVVCSNDRSVKILGMKSS
jgi:WD40 repeat protein